MYLHVFLLIRISICLADAGFKNAKRTEHFPFFFFSATEPENASEIPTIGAGTAFCDFHCSFQNGNIYFLKNIIKYL